MEDFVLNSLEKTKNRLNTVYFQLRKQIAFSRANYHEFGQRSAYQSWLQSLRLKRPDSIPLMQNIEENYEFADYRKLISIENYQKSLATLWVLEQFSFADLSKKQNLQVVEAGAQDFSRAPAIHRFLQKQDFDFHLTGIELDAFPVLKGAYSRFDKARFFCRLLPKTRYVAADFFQWQEPMDLFICFYPFVSPHPALAWGIPVKYANPSAWLRAMSMNLKKHGYALVVHQGDWEEKEWDQARKDFPFFRLLARKQMNCPFYPLPYPAHVSLYTVE